MIEKAAKYLVNSYLERRYHLNQKKKALSTLKKIESSKGKIDTKLIKLCDQYASEVLGWIGYSPWLYVYSAISGNFKKGWIPDNYYGQNVVPKLKGDYGKVSALKPLNIKIFSSDLFPDIAYQVNGLWTSSDGSNITESFLKDFLFINQEKIVFKLDNSGQGRGIYFFTKENFDKDYLKTLGNGVIQKYIYQHNFFKDLSPKAVATLRITTIIDDGGKPSIRACYLRVGRSKDPFVKSESHIRIPVCVKSGRLKNYGFTTDWIAISKHPDNNVSFKNKKIPFYNECIDSVIELHKRMKFVRSIGWDLVVDNNNTISIMEWNGTYNDIKFSEATQGPCFPDLGWENLWKFD